MKVLHLFPVHDIGGAESVLLNLMRFRRRADVVHEALLIANEDGALGAELTKMGTPWARAPRVNLTKSGLSMQWRRSG